MLTVYRDSSEVSLLNRHAAQHPVAISRELSNLIQNCQEISRATEGAFDLTTGPLIKAWGFYHRAGAIPLPDALQAARNCVGSEFLEMSADGATVAFRKPGMELNFGACGKGYALDRAADKMLA